MSPPAGRVYCHRWYAHLTTRARNYLGDLDVGFVFTAHIPQFSCFVQRTGRATWLVEWSALGLLQGGEYRRLTPSRFGVEASAMDLYWMARKVTILSRSRVMGAEIWVTAFAMRQSADYTRPLVLQEWKNQMYERRRLSRRYAARTLITNTTMLCTTAFHYHFSYTSRLLQEVRSK